MSTGNKPRVGTLDTTMDILNAVRDLEPVQLSTLDRELEYAKSTIHAQLATLSEYGFVVRNNNKYSIGLVFLNWGIHARNNQPLFHSAHKKVDELASATEEQVWCVVREKDQAVYIYSSSGGHSVSTDEQDGEFRDLHCIAAGKAILAHTPRDTVEEIIDKRGLTAHTEFTITDRDAFFEELDSIRDRGVAYNFQEVIEGVNAIAAPVLMHDGGVYGAVSIGGPANRLTKERLKNELEQLLLGATNEVELTLRHTSR